MVNQYEVWSLTFGGGGTLLGDVFAENEEEAEKMATEKFNNNRLRFVFKGVMTKKMAEEEKKKYLPIGKYSCPNCHSKHTKCEKEIGCAIIIIIFISFGLGLIMIPFLPYRCLCLECGHKWKA